MVDPSLLEDLGDVLPKDIVACESFFNEFHKDQEHLLSDAMVDFNIMANCDEWLSSPYLQHACSGN